MNRNAIVVIFSVFFFNTSTECMLKRASQSLLACRHYSASKSTIPAAATQESPALLSNEERNKQLTAAIAAASAEKIKAHEEEKIKKALDGSANLTLTCMALDTASSIANTVTSLLQD